MVNSIFEHYNLMHVDPTMRVNTGIHHLCPFLHTVDNRALSIARCGVTTSSSTGAGSPVRRY